VLIFLLDTENVFREIVTIVTTAAGSKSERIALRWDEIRVNARIPGVQTPIVPDQIKAPPGTDLILVAHAEGVQIYICRGDETGELSWTLKGPEARLLDHAGYAIGSHYAGPSWKHNDGSEISAKLAVKIDSPDIGAIPWLLLEVTGHRGQGIFSRATSIQRINTSGGLPPAPSVAELKPDQEFRSPYSADYYFYAPSK